MLNWGVNFKIDPREQRYTPPKVSVNYFFIFFKKWPYLGIIYALSCFYAKTFKKLFLLGFFLIKRCFFACFYAVFPCFL